MSGKINEAIARITQESYRKDHLIVFEEYLTSICTTDDIAEKILNRDKTLQGCFTYMRDKACKKQVNGTGFFSPEEGFAIIRDYYGITDRDKDKDRSDVIDIMDLL